MKTHVVAIGFALLVTSFGTRAQDAAAGTLRLHPGALHFSAATERPRVVVVWTDAHGITHDVTAETTFEVAEPVLDVDSGRALPRAVGATELVARYRGLDARIPAEVRAVVARPNVSFRNDVLPILTRAGCNAGSCHGAATGKNGFRLSLFGYDPELDHRTVTRELRGRRIDPSHPDLSLLLAKPTRAVQHKGGKRLEHGGAAWSALVDWIAAGAVDDGAEAPELTGLSVEPARLVFASAGSTARVTVQAHYADGARRDVTELALLSSSSEPTLTVDAEGLVTTGEPGQATVLARFGGRAQVCRVDVLTQAEPLADWPVEADETPHWIDELVHDRLRELRTRPTEPCDDATFLRRAWLDLANGLPSVEETEAFLADEAVDKRRRLVEELVQRDDFADVWAAQWGELLRIEERNLREKGVAVYARWLREQFRAWRPFDELVHELLTASGGNLENPPASFWVAERDTKAMAELVAQDFLGVRVQCAQCHNHPFERWTMDDYYGFASFVGQVNRKRGEDYREFVVWNRGRGDLTNPRSGRVTPPKFLGGPSPEIKRGQDRRAVLADWLASAENALFARNVANRIWARFFGRGVVEPVDDVRVSNPPSHPELWARLGEKLVEYDWDFRKLAVDICTSRTYQLAVREGGGAGPAEASIYASMNVRRLSAEQALDAIADVTGVPNRLRGTPPGSSAMLADGANPGSAFLELFGRPSRQSVCACERRGEPTLNQVLHLINGSTVESKLASGARRLATADAAPAAVVHDVWLAAYCRPPRDDELHDVLAVVEDAASDDARERAWQDVLWAVINSKEFLFQH